VIVTAGILLSYIVYYIYQNVPEMRKKTRITSAIFAEKWHLPQGSVQLLQ